jgi:uncharacterized Ntn-hydrolase superfamily protein
MSFQYGDRRPQQTSATHIIDALERHPEISDEQLIVELDAVTADNRDPIADREMIRAAQRFIRAGNRSAARDVLVRRRVYREEQAQRPAV